ncbi:hypothetical protein LOK49_LG05G00613 [Camellia lanceoleosa]|uniref:Uncharacterized protein n=1 Tax=Camellia lanceoleosa TaxID=1840588 RepID=A0ACC0HLJ8_9ERIC|nr:hypothetical protein LOK49_LG05G00613 [Camellia lanceoleosa]
MGNFEAWPKASLGHPHSVAVWLGRPLAMILPCLVHIGHPKVQSGVPLGVAEQNVSHLIVGKKQKEKDEKGNKSQAQHMMVHMQGTE